MQEMKLMSAAEALDLLSDELAEESAKADAYREAAITLIDHIANEMAFKVRDDRDARREEMSKLILATPPSSATN
jgi:hypothetical protein